MSQRRSFNKGRYIASLVGAIILLFLLNTVERAFSQSNRRNEIKKEESFERPEPTRPIRPEIPGANRFQEDKVFLEYADSLYKVRSRDTIERQILKGSVKFRQAGLWMYCDSAYYYPQQNSLDAFSNVRMEQGDTLFVYADQLYYNGDTKMANLKNGPSRDKVTMINRDVTLTTDSFDYDLGIDLGWYSRWGTIDDKVNTLTSLYGEYSPATKKAEFYHDVVLVNNRDGFTMLTDTLHYNTATHIADIDSKTEIRSENDTIFTNLATYYTDTGDADLLSRSLIIHRDSTGNVTTLEGDSIIYDNASRISRVFMFQDPYKHSYPMVLTDTAQKTTLIGGYGVYNDSTKEALATIYPLLMEYSQGDTIFLRADTIKTYIVTEMRPFKRRRIITESGLPENNGIPIVRIDSTRIWIDSIYFSVVIPYVDTPIENLLQSLPPKPDEDSFNINSDSIAILDSIPLIINEEGIPETLVTSVSDSILFIDTLNPGIEEININEKLNQNQVGIELIEADSIAYFPQIQEDVQEHKKKNTEKNIQEDTVEVFLDNYNFNNPPDIKLFLDSLSKLIFFDSIAFEDYLSLNPDSMKMMEDSVETLKREIIDSIPYEYHVAVAYHRGRFFKQDMQGVADSLMFIEKDSMLYMFRKPIIWSGERQVTGNRIDVHFNDSTADWAYLPESGLISEYVDEDFYNQIAGKEITAYFDNQTLSRLSVSGNVETIFLPQEADSTFNRLVSAESSYLELDLKDNKMDRLKMWPEVSGTVTPIFMVKRSQQYLQRFKWWGFLRPEREWYGDRMHWADNLGEVPDELEQYFNTPSDFGEPKSFPGSRPVNIPKPIISFDEGIPEFEELDTIIRSDNEIELAIDSLNRNMEITDSISKKDYYIEEEKSDNTEIIDNILDPEELSNQEKELTISDIEAEGKEMEKTKEQEETQFQEMIDEVKEENPAFFKQEGIPDDDDEDIGKENSQEKEEPHNE